MRARQQAILDHIRTYWLEHGYGPGYREIANAGGISSTSVVEYNVQQMTARGQLISTPGVPHSLLPAEWRAWIREVSNV